MRFTRHKLDLTFKIAAALLAVLAIALPALAQTTTATVKGTVSTKDGPMAGALVAAVDATTGFVYQSKSGSDGSYVLSGLRPGTYDVRVSAPSFTPQAKTIQVAVGQSYGVDFRVTPESLFVEDVTVVGDRLVETRTSVVGTSVSKEQIELLPQNNRNFLNFAALAPGVRISDDPNNKQFRALGQPGNSTNVFIDGVSYKNDVLEGGVVGQDASRGNPFPQNAVQEFQVLTQNYKAEYEKASTGIISAVTKSGSNEFSGNVFLLLQNKGMVSNDFFADKNNSPKPDYKRYQGGFDLGGPIIKDKLTWFASYEQNHQNRANTVTPGTPPAAGAVFDPADFAGYAGTFTSPFRSKLFFGKLSWQPRTDQALDVTYNLRNESDKRSFGGQTSFETGEDLKIDVNTFAAKHKLIRERFLNEASLQWQGFEWNPASISNAPQRVYSGFLTVGSRNGNQDFKQDSLVLREDFTWFGLKGHTMKTGLVVNFGTYDVTKTFGGAGRFEFANDPGNGHSFDAPWQAFIQKGDPRLKTDNTQYGLYFQDDWQVSPKLTLNLGLRWDYESDMVNTSFQTPPEFVTALSGGILNDVNDPNSGLAPVVWNQLSASDQANYFSSGSNRKAFTGAIQPRLGFSYDFTGAGKSVLFAGLGRYYDRDIYNVFFDEKFRLQWREYRFCFYSNPTEQAICGANGIAWDQSLLSTQALLNLSSGPALGTPEIFLLPNDLKMPYNDQASVGYRRTFGRIVGEATLTSVRGKNGFTYIFGNRRTDNGNTTNVSTQFSNLLLGTDDKEYWYNGLYLKAERPFTTDAKWGFTAAYTYAKAKQRGNDAFSLDFLTVADYPKAPTFDDERHRLVATGIVRIPWDVVLSSNLTLGSGLPYDINDCSAGCGFFEIVRSPRGGRPEKKAFIVGKLWAYRQLDLRAEKTFRLPGKQSLGVSLEGFNVFNYDNFSCFDGFIGTGGNPNFGQPGCTVGPTRQFQVGVKYGF